MFNTINSNLGLMDVSINVEISESGQHLAFLREGPNMVLLLQSDLIDLRDLLNSLDLPVQVKV